MAVYEKRYRPYTGALTARRWRFLVLPRYAYRSVFDSRIFGLVYLMASVLLPLAVALILYIPHNLRFLETFGLTPELVTAFFRFDGAFFLAWFLAPEGFLAIIVALVVGPTLISADLRNNGLPLYLSRPFSRAEYLLGKSAVLLILLSLVTWIPGLLLFLFQCMLGGWSWFAENWTIAPALFFASWIWILVLCLLSLAFSAYLKWKPLAQAALLGVFFISAVLAGIVNVMFQTSWGSLLNISEMVARVWADLFGVPSETDLPVAACWIGLIAVCAACLGVLARKVRAYEVVRS